MTRPAGIMALSALMGLLPGCGTTRWSDTARTATEQLLISDAIDRAVKQIDVAPFEGRRVFVDTQYLDDTVQQKYLISSIRQHFLDAGCYLQEKRDAADYVVELRSGAIGTDRNDVLLGMPQMNLPATIPGAPAQFPEVPLIKRTKQEGVAKIALFAYERDTGRQVWAHDTLLADSTSQKTWVFGAGPFGRMHDRKGYDFAGERLDLPGLAESKSKGRPKAKLSFSDPWPQPSQPIEQAGHVVPRP